MTNKEDETDSPCEPRLAALLAVHVVSQVLDEAYVIVNAAIESGQPWRYWTSLKDLKSCRLGDVEEESIYFNLSKEDTIETTNFKMNDSTTVSHMVATSTPQKISDDIQKISNNTSLIGQGDEETRSLDVLQSDYDTSTSMFINNLFDMSEVERVMYDEIESAKENSVLLFDAIATILNTAIGEAITTRRTLQFDQDDINVEHIVDEKSESTNYSEYSFLTDACATEHENAMGDVAFCENDEVASGSKDMASSSAVPDMKDLEINKSEKQEDINQNEIARFENAFLTLNRDYDQSMEDNGEPVLQDSKGMLMQEVELIDLRTPDDAMIKSEIEQPENTDLKATSAVSGPASSRKSSLVHRCRTQGARLLACLRGWWRRKTPGKRKEARFPGSARGICPLSPDARRRAASLLDQRRLYSPTPSQHVVWKFNTVSEAVVNSNRWNNYTFDHSEKCTEY